MKFFYGTFLLLFFACKVISVAASPSGADSTVYVDEKGLMRWNSTKKEVFGFGVNYTVPFAYGFRSARQKGIDIKKAIDNDVYHFARLGFDAFRVHVWDTEISDTAGNLTDNEHLELFDYLLFKMKQRNILFLITPIAYWGNGWPEPDENTTGFSHKYGKDKCLTDTAAVKAQQNYLFQFLNHVNTYTGVAYKDEPSLIAFEISNEPHHREAPEKVTEFIKGMIASMRNTGCKKPIFYNISHSIHLEQAYFDAGINGGTFQWYPTGLGFKQELSGNMLPNVDDYNIPFFDNSAFKKIAKVVYEFDAADMGRSYIYPAMARSFRKAGIQWATQFAYDPTYTAYANTEYDTHFMNLVYAPQKALSLMIAGEVFHRVPLYKNYGLYPSDTSFDGFKVSYENDLAEYVGDEKFIYTNNTTALPPSPQKLTLIAGFGNSPLVQYNGKGAYFLDKISDGVWRLEVLPDAIWVNDPFGRNSLKKTNVVIKWQLNKMRLQIAGLGNDFSVKALDDGNAYNTSSLNGGFTVQPGTYMLVSHGSSAAINGTFSKNIGLKEFAAPSTTIAGTYVLHQPAAQVTAGDSIVVDAVVASNIDIKFVELFITGGRQVLKLVMNAADAFHYRTTIPSALVKVGYLKYHIVVTGNEGPVTFPPKVSGIPADWDFYSADAYSTTVVSKSSPIYLFDAFADAASVNRNWLPTSSLVPAAEQNKAFLNINVEKLADTDIENPTGKKVADYSLRYFFGTKIGSRISDLSEKKWLVLKAHSLNNRLLPLQVALTDNFGNSYGGTLNVGTAHGEYRLAISKLMPVQTVLLPRPYPSFLPYYFKHEKLLFDVSNARSLQISVGPGISEDLIKSANGFSLESVWLE
jgi:hypothetical protein